MGSAASASHGVIAGTKPQKGARGDQVITAARASPKDEEVLPSYYLQKMGDQESMRQTILQVLNNPVEAHALEVFLREERSENLVRLAPAAPPSKGLFPPTRADPPPPLKHPTRPADPHTVTHALSSASSLRSAATRRAQVSFLNATRRFAPPTEAAARTWARPVHSCLEYDLRDASMT